MVHFTTGQATHGQLGPSYAATGDQGGASDPVPNTSTSQLAGTAVPLSQPNGHSSTFKLLMMKDMPDMKLRMAALEHKLDTAIQLQTLKQTVDIIGENI